MARHARPLYVEIAMRAPIDEVWRRSQDPDDHSRWDLRFTRIEMLDPTTVTDGTPRHFRYAVDPVTGVGVTSADRRLPDGSATSALRFSSDHPLSAIRSGSGYWRYLPAAGDTTLGPPGGTTFLTRYDYVPRGSADRFVRPLLGWATAWSFDRLRLWVDEGVTPEQATSRALLKVVGRLLAGGLGIGLMVTAYGPGLVTTGLVERLALLSFGIVLLLGGLIVPPHRLTPSARRCLRRPTRSVHSSRPTTEVLP